MGKRDYYLVLGVPRNADDAELKRAYREMARRFHPDINPGPDNENTFKEVNEAYAVLSQPSTRSQYDKYGHAGVGTANGSGGFATVVDAFDDIISDILRRRKPTRKRGADRRYTLELSLHEASLGCKKTIAVPAADGGSKEFVVSIPVATADGAVRRIRGEGEPGAGGADAGDLHVIIRVAEDSMLSRDGADIWCDVPISFSQAALGAVIDIPSLSGQVKLRVPEGSQSGRVLRMRGKGVPKGGSNKSTGDQLVRLVVETPTGLSEEQKDLLRKFASADGSGLAIYPRRRGFVEKLRSLFREV